MSTKAQASTRYINYDNFGYYTPPQIEENKQAKVVYDDFMNIVEIYYNKLQDLDINKEHIANILPLGMETKIVFQCNLRELIHIFGLRSCSRAYIEARELCKVLKNEIINIDDEWRLIADKFLKPKCKTCTEKNNCEVSNG